MLLQCGLPTRFDGDCRITTMIHFLLGGSDYSAWHRLQDDETWSVCFGDPVRVYMINETDATLTHQDLGTDLASGQAFHSTVAHGVWFAAERVPPAVVGHALVGAGVSPVLNSRPESKLLARSELDYPHILLCSSSPSLRACVGCTCRYNLAAAEVGADVTRRVVSLQDSICYLRGKHSPWRRHSRSRRRSTS